MTTILPSTTIGPLRASPPASRSGAIWTGRPLRWKKRRTDRTHPGQILVDSDGGRRLHRPAKKPEVDDLRRPRPQRVSGE